MESAELKSLLGQYLTGTISDVDFRRLWETLNEPSNEQEWLIAIEEAISLAAPSGYANTQQAQITLQHIKEKIYEDAHQPSRIYQLYSSNKRMVKYAAAAMVIVSATMLVKFSFNKTETANQTAVAVKPVHDVDPGGQKALLTLADGSTIVLDNANNGHIAQQGHVQVIKLDNGEIQYKAISDKEDDGVMAFNTMSTPRGGQYQLILPDGSKVWLNSESSITYPVSFDGGRSNVVRERRVQITGEAYFEVAKDKSKPFRVVTADMVVEVLGTHFNVKAYADDGPTKTSLLEGSVKIDKQILKPGEAFMDGKIVPTDVNQDVAWKNGIFNFNNQNLMQVMKQLARWYDLEVIYPDGVPQKEYGGEIGRNLKLNQVLRGLEYSGVHFELNGKRVMVKK